MYCDVLFSSKIGECILIENVQGQRFWKNVFVKVDICVTIEESIRKNETVIHVAVIGLLPFEMRYITLKSSSCLSPLLTLILQISVDHFAKFDSDFCVLGLPHQAYPVGVKYNARRTEPEAVVHFKRLF